MRLTRVVAGITRPRLPPSPTEVKCNARAADHSSMKLVAALLLTLLALSLGVAPARASVTVGVADLNAWTPNVSVGCSQLPIFGWPTNASTCTYWTTAAHVFSPEGTNIVPKGYGVITRIRVKTAGVPQGPMQAVTFRSIRQSNSTGFPGCCWAQYATPAFTPASGGITEVETHLPVMNVTLLQQFVGSGDFSYTPAPGSPPWLGTHAVPAGTQGIENYDALALSILDPSTPIPATDTFDRSNGPSAGALWPAATDRSLRTETGGLNGIQVLLQGVWEPDADTDGLGDESQDPDGGHPAAPAVPDAGPTTTPPPPAPLTIPTTARLRGRAAQIALTCRLAIRCRGTLRLLAPPRTPAKSLAYGSAAFSIPAGATRKITVKLNRAARKKLARRRSLAVLAQATIADTLVSTSVTLRRSH